MPLRRQAFVSVSKEHIDIKLQLKGMHALVSCHNGDKNLYNYLYIVLPLAFPLFSQCASTTIRILILMILTFKSQKVC